MTYSTISFSLYDMPIEDQGELCKKIQNSGSFVTQGNIALNSSTHEYNFNDCCFTIELAGDPTIERNWVVGSGSISGTKENVSRVIGELGLEEYLKEGSE